jgi:hypothetical protein
VNQVIPLFQAEKTAIIEEARIRFDVLEGGSLTCILYQAPSETALASGTAITTAVQVGTGATSKKTVTLPFVTSNSNSTQLPTQNVVPGDTVSARAGTVTPGSTMGLVFDGPPSTLDQGVITLRITQKRQ